MFLHSPFPSSEIFRTFPKREELLRSMLNADLIGTCIQHLRHSVLLRAGLGRIQLEIGNLFCA